MKESLNIIIFYQYFGTPKGSWSTRVYELSRRWVEKGHSVKVITSPYYKSDIKPSGFISKQNIDGIELIVINAADSNKDKFYKRATNAILFSLTSIYFALFTKADIVVSSSGPITVAIPGLLMKWLRNKKFVFEARDLWPAGAIELGKLKNVYLKSIAIWFEKLCYRNAALIVPCSPGMERGVKKTWPEANTIVIPNASDFKLFQNPQGAFNLPENLKSKSIFLYAGSLGLMDDCTQSIRAMKYLIHKPYALVFAGDGAERKYLEELAGQTKNPNIYFLGLLPKNDLVHWFHHASASIVTFKDISVLHTSSPNKMFDSFAAGVPIIQTTKGWIKELVSQEYCGINVDPDNPRQFADAIAFIAENLAERNKMAKNAKELALKRFNRDILAEAYLKQLEEISL